MHKTLNAEWEQQNDRTGSGGELPATVCRRSLFVATAGGLALATTGLILPEWLEEAEAREGAVGGVRGGRRGRNRRGRNKHKHRDHHKKKKKKNRKKGQNAPGSGLSDPGIEFDVELIGGRPIKVDFYTNAGYDRDYWAFTDRETLALPGQGGPTYTFATGDRAGALWIDDRYLVEAIKVHYARPRLTMGFNGEFIDRTQDGWRNGSIEFDGYPREGEGVQPMRVNGYTFQPTLIQENTKRIVYKVTITAPAA